MPSTGMRSLISVQNLYKRLRILGVYKEQTTTCKCSANLEKCLWWVKCEAPKVGSTIQLCIMKYSVIKIIYVLNAGSDVAVNTCCHFVLPNTSTYVPYCYAITVRMLT